MLRRLFLSIISCFFPLVLFAQFNQWEPDNGVPLRLAPDINYDGCMETNSAGNTLFAWSEFSGNSRKIKTMLINSDGSYLWNSPLVICDMEVNQDFPAILALNNGQWIVAWMDFRNHSFGNFIADIYVQKINENGNLLFAPEGLLISQNVYEFKIPPKLIADNNDFLITWINDITYDYNLYAQRVNNSGNILWDNGGILIAGGELNRSSVRYGYYDVISDNNGGLIFGFLDYVEDSGNFVGLQHISENGEALWTDSVDERLCISTISSYNGDLQLASDGNSGVLATWCRNNVEELPGQVYAQHLDQNGHCFWTDNGENISQMEYGYCYEPKICNTSENEAIILYKHAPDDDFHFSLYGQKISGLNNIDLNWNEGQSVLVAEYADSMYYYRNHDLVSDGNGGAFISWRSRLSANRSRGYLSAQHINSDGILSWNHDVLLQGANSAVKPVIKSIEPNQAILSWNSYPAIGSSVQTQIIDISANTIFGDGGSSILNEIDYSSYKVSTVKSGENIYTAWLDHRSINGQSTSRPFVQRIDTDGNFFFGNNGLCLAPALYEKEFYNIYDCDSLKICSDGAGGIYAAWNQRGEIGVIETAIQHLDVYGDLLWDNTGLIISNDNYRDLSVQDIVTIGDDGFLLFYTELNDLWYLEFKCMRYNFEREAEWDEPLVFPTVDESDNHYLASMKLNENEIVVAYVSDDFDSDSHIYVQSFDIDKNIIWANPINYQLTAGYNLSIQTPLLKLNDNILFIWLDREDQMSQHIYGSLISPDGEFLWENDSILLFSDFDYISSIEAATTPEDNYSFWVTFCGYRQSEEYCVFVQRFNYQGQGILPGNNGICINDPEQSAFNPQICVLEDNSSFISWSEEAENGNYDLKYLHLDSEGAPVNSGIPYPDHGALLSEAKNNQENVQLIPVGESGFIAFWHDYRSSMGEYYSCNIYMQKVDDGFSGVKNSSNTSQPYTFKILNTWPNPFNPSINISYQLEKAGHVRISVYDILGREVVNLLDQNMKAGQHLVSWNSSNDNKNGTASGTYFLKIESNQDNLVRRISLIK